ncbi:uncharacterized protein LOC123402218 [Hordeum vulgare subsp. vulgare]|nr:uncharacterized protein LOC123402218 [Hordeum vulgare subsp. vulgare]
MTLAWVEHWVKWLSDSVFRIVPLLSLLMHLILTVFSDSRRREGKGWKRGLLWLAYQLTDWGPAYVIGNLYLEKEPCGKMIVAFWVPFLLLQNARPDNISAYTIEDNELWLRVVIFVPLQSLGSILVVYRCILTNCCTTGLLRQASIIMLVVGLLKYVESAVALWLCNLSRIQKSFKKLPPIDCSLIDDYGGGKNLKDEQALLVAHGLFDICKGAFSDYSMEHMDRAAVTSMFSDQWKSMCKVVEMELSLMYDILYTKAAVVHTWPGYAIRVASPLLTATALVLFGLQCKEGMHTEDQVISYVLLGTTFLLDLRWLLRALASTWTYSFFKGAHSCLNHQVLCRKRWHKLRCWVVSLSISRLSLWLWTSDCPKKHESYRRWEGTFGRYNLLEQCCGGERHNLYSISRLVTESEDHSRDHGIPDYVKELVFNVICANLFPAPSTPTGTPPNGSPQTPDPSNGDGGGGKNSPDRQNGNGTYTPPGTDSPGVPNCNCMCNLPPSWPFYPREPFCNCMCNLPPSWPFYPREPFCNDMHNDPPLCPFYPRRPICSGMDNERPPCRPCPRQICARGINAPFDQNGYDVFVSMQHCPDEETSMASSGPYEQQTDDRWRYDQAQSETYEQACLWRNVHAGSMHGQSTLINNPKRQATSLNSTDFPLELQEAILIWHIATDLFLSCYHNVVPAAPQNDEKAIKAMSDYMMFLLAKQPSMLPGLKLRSLYEKARATLRVIGKIKEEDKPSSSYTTTKEQKAKELATWMLENVDHLEDKTSAIYRGIKENRLLGLGTLGEATQIALFLSDGKHRLIGNAMEKSVRKLGYWIRTLQELREDMNDNDMLKFILKAWVHLLMYASIRGSREAHAKQLSKGGGLTTLVWIISEHAEERFVRLMCPALFL